MFSFQMAKVRRMLTEILLEVTNEEIEDISREVMKKEHQKALKGIAVLSAMHIYARYPRKVTRLVIMTLRQNRIIQSSKMI